MRGQVVCSCVLVGDFFCSSFLLFGGRWSGVFVCNNDVVSDDNGSGWGGENVQWCAVLGVDGWLEGFG